MAQVDIWQPIFSSAGRRPGRRGDLPDDVGLGPLVVHITVLESLTYDNGVGPANVDTEELT
eukprot:CAMPEP_0185911362 /NCGR_PEP_ID=MMETSP0196C-20130402/27994_1 /TAXON_ID=2932 /ORGANISM="Alexandrium fundyense, Strain CCMP1719" /LENGTH=60 /DNA_ID=CAMNT_0028632397 /DNA_START=35 /DNA_END=213 /DNA_ORIENTATION=-